MEVIVVSYAKFTVVALNYDTIVFNRLSTNAKMELLSGKRQILTKKSVPVKPFDSQIVATSFQDHFIKDSYRLFKGHIRDCVSFIEFYTSTEDFNPVQFTYYTKYGNIIKVKTLSEFLKLC